MLLDPFCCVFASDLDQEMLTLQNSHCLSCITPSLPCEGATNILDHVVGVVEHFGDMIYDMSCNAQPLVTSTLRAVCVTRLDAHVLPAAPAGLARVSMLPLLVPLLHLTLLAAPPRKRRHASFWEQGGLLSLREGAGGSPPV
jgi:hypothetical protein